MTTPQWPDGEEELDDLPSGPAFDDDAPLPRLAATDPLRPVRAQAARRFLAFAAALALAAAAMTSLLPQDLPEGRRPLLLALQLAYSGLALLALRARTEWVDGAATALAALAVVVIGGSVVIGGFGIDASALGLLGVLVMFGVAVLPPGGAALLVALAVAAVAAIGGAEALGLLAPARGPLGGDVLLLGLLQSALVIAAGVAGGWMLVRLVTRHVLAADERERRFLALLAVAADGYWELDARYRVVTLTLPSGPGRSAEVGDGAVGQLPWELPSFLMDADSLDLLQAHLEARSAFRDLPFQWAERDGTVLDAVLSGEPRLNRRGVFRGYWGVVRDVGADVRARQALAATEGRYQDLFDHIPTALVLHRAGRIVDANPAALAMLTHDGGPAGLAGLDLMSFFEPGDSQERARRRLDELETMPIGVALPVSDFRLRGREGRTYAVRGTGVRVDAPGGAATLTILVDDTERRAAEDAVRRSETMLSHLVATSPEVITLTDLETGRYVMVNRTFERATGYAAQEVVGRSSLELGVWARAEDRAALTARIARDGHVEDWPATFRGKDGRLLDMRISGARFLMDRREYLVINARDVTAAERERLERAAILHTASIGIALTRDRRFVLANPCLERLCGWPEGSMAGQPGRIVWASDEEYARIGEMLAPRLAAGEVVEFETELTRRDGSRFLARLTVNPIDPLRPREGGTVWIVEDVTAQRQAEADLARARDEAEAANRAKSAFLANTSHELRTPLNGMIGLARLARDPSIDEARRREYLEQIGDGAQSLAAIISDILDLSKIESGKLALENTVFDLGALLRTLQLGYRMLADAHGLALHLEVEPGSDGHVVGDPLRVRQILSNFLSNAVKFTVHGEVGLRVARLDERVLRFEVRDTGPGIDAGTMARLFRPFTQADESTTRRFGGTGLGLSICRELATLMGGRVGADSTPGAGSCFWAELPLPAADAPSAALADEMPEVRGARVLLVEDNPVNMLIAAAMLEQWGVSVEQASDGGQALEAVARARAIGEPFDAVLMDVQMPQMSGYEATQALRRQPGGGDLPVIALTAAALVTEREAAMAAGMNDFLTKPIDPDRLRATLARWIGWRAAPAD